MLGTRRSRTHGTASGLRVQRLALTGRLAEPFDARPPTPPAPRRSSRSCPSRRAPAENNAGNEGAGWTKRLPDVEEDGADPSSHQSTSTTGRPAPRVLRAMPSLSRTTSANAALSSNGSLGRQAGTGVRLVHASSHAAVDLRLRLRRDHDHDRDVAMRPGLDQAAANRARPRRRCRPARPITCAIREPDLRVHDRLEVPAGVIVGEHHMSRAPARSTPPSGVTICVAEPSPTTSSNPGVPGSTTSRASASAVDDDGAMVGEHARHGGLARTDARR